MSLYVRARSEDKAKEMLNNLLARYGAEIVDYGLEEDIHDLSNPPENVEVEFRRLTQRGETLGLNVPAYVRKYLDLKKGDYIAFVINRKSGSVYLTKLKKVQTLGRISIC